MNLSLYLLVCENGIEADDGAARAGNGLVSEIAVCSDCHVARHFAGRDHLGALLDFECLCAERVGGGE